ncbi:pyruvate kinase [candidate division KSB1 bacterium]|nr:pyruvate kinase [candidate division KSB1 bacterium]
MKFGRKKIEKMILQIDAICKNSRKLEKQYASALAKVHPSFQEGAINLFHYLALRYQDIRGLQDKLGFLGVSRLGRAESHVMASLLAVREILTRFAKSKPLDNVTPIVSFKQGKKLLRNNTSALLGKKLKGSKARIMVTLPAEAAEDKGLVLDLVAAGMSCARINCAHDDEEIWKAMIGNIERAKRKTGRNCKICMDLGGPKLRTGAMMLGPQVVHLQPKRDLFGHVISPARVWLAASDIQPPSAADAFLAISTDGINHVEKGDKIRFMDARGKRCTLVIDEPYQNGRWAYCLESAYIVTGTELRRDNENAIVARVGELPAVEQSITLKTGDTLVLHAEATPGGPAQYDAEGNLLQPAHISCTLPEVFQFVKVGEPILLDDGKIEGVIRSASEESLQVEITYAKEEGAKLRADKGINLPESDLQLRGLTDKDKEDLKFIAKHADVVSLSFVNGPQDVIALLKALKKLRAKLGLIVKIETQRGFQNLPAILLAAMRTHPVGVMIARGDLAIEAGWRNLAGIQEEILWLCEAAHLPIIWATQVLETLAKKGIPSRAEISDAAMAQQAECVMLNKGPHILETVRMLDDILKSMEEYHQKKAPMLPALKASGELSFKWNK